MATMVLDSAVEARLKAERKASGADQYDEVWEGVYMMAPLADDEHQDLQIGLAAAIKIAVGWAGLGMVRAGVNVSDREHGWTQNYRIPDVAVFFPDGSGRNLRTHWVGGPDFAIEIASPGDRSRDKLDFYAANRVRELLLIERDPWMLELYGLKSGHLALVGRVEPGDSQTLKSGVVPVSFQLMTGTPRPQIHVAHNDGIQAWTV